MGLFVYNLDVREVTPVLIHPVQPAADALALVDTDPASWSVTVR